MTVLTPATELLMAGYGVDCGGTERLARAVSAMDGLILPYHVIQLRNAAAAWLADPADDALYQGLHEALTVYCRCAVGAWRPEGIPAEVAALLAEPPSWTERADLQ